MSMSAQPISRLDTTGSIRGDDLLLISRKQSDGKYGLSYQLSVSQLSNTILSGFLPQTQKDISQLSDNVQQISSDLLSANLSIYLNNLSIIQNKNDISSILSSIDDLSTNILVKRERKQSVGSITIPVYVDDTGYTHPISAYNGQSLSAIYSKNDRLGNDIVDTYLNKITGGTISGDLKMLVDGDEKSLSTLLKEAGSVKTVNSVSANSDNGNVQIYAADITLLSTNNKTIYDELLLIYKELNNQITSLESIV